MAHLQESETLVARDQTPSENHCDDDTNVTTTVDRCSNETEAAPDSSELEMQERTGGEETDHLYDLCGAPKPSHFRQQLQIPEYGMMRAPEPLLHPRYRRGKTRSNCSGSVAAHAASAQRQQCVTQGRETGAVPVDPFGPFATKEGPEQQLQRLQKIQTESPTYFRTIMEQGSYLVELARDGKVSEISQLVSMARDTELLHFYNARMFMAASENAQLKTMLYMIASGLDTRLPLLRTVMHDVIRKIEQDRKLCLVLRTLNKLGFDVDEPDPDSGMTPLHIACSMGRYGPAETLVNSLNADVNAVATANRMPLPLAEEAKRRLQRLLDSCEESEQYTLSETQGTGESGMSHGVSINDCDYTQNDNKEDMKRMHADCKALITFLEGKGARRTWRNLAAKETTAQSSMASLSIQDNQPSVDADGGYTLNAQNE